MISKIILYHQHGQNGNFLTILMEKTNGKQDALTLLASPLGHQCVCFVPIVNPSVLKVSVLLLASHAWISLSVRVSSGVTMGWGMLWVRNPGAQGPPWMVSLGPSPHCFGAQRIRAQAPSLSMWLFPGSNTGFWKADASVPAGIYSLKRYPTFGLVESRRGRERGVLP